MQRLSRPVRRATLFVHVSAAASWLGTSLCLLALAVTGTAAGGTAGGAAGGATATGSYRAMKVFGDWLLAPVSLLTLTTGLILSLGTHWGLARHRWVYTKFWLTLVTTAASIFAFRATIDSAVSASGAGQHVDPVDLLIPPCVSLSAYLFMTALSVLKPWGLTRRGRKARPSRPSSPSQPSRPAPSEAR
ncbi:membrane protein [Streptomyces albiaxialis]|uniref:Membrane protein n=1 Tax=Streptomyces albiaxialis TaxID=329523 RepID=A0ABN2VLA1_9ACTN